MKLHITYNLQDLNQALKIAEQTAEYADIIGVGSLLIFKEGIKAIKTFKATFPNKEIFAEANISEKAGDAVKIIASAGASYISVFAGAFHNTIKKAVEAAKEFDVKIALDLLSSSSIGQSALDAKTLGAHMLILHRSPSIDTSTEELESEFCNVRDNTKLPIFIAGKIDISNIEQIKALKPRGIIICNAITKADNPAKAAYTFKSLIEK